jgi:antitoxin HicB
VAAKIELHNAMLEERVGKYRLGKKLDGHLPQVERLIDFRHQSKLDQIEQALSALGRRLVVTSAA